MGTRNLTIVRLDGEVKVAQYCQWDGYPKGTGEDIAKFLRGLDAKSMAAFKKNVKGLKWAGKDVVEKLWKDCGADNSGLVSMDISDRFKAKHPEFHRDTGAEVLGLIASGQVKLVLDDTEFLNDATFCEYAYEIDLTTETITVFVSGKKWEVLTFKEWAVPGAMAKLEGE